MQYRNFGRSNVSLSTLGFGAMRLPQDADEAVSVIHRALDQGVNYIDTAPGYGESELRVGRAIATYPGPKPYISTKNPLTDNTAAGWRERLEKSLERLGVGCIDFYQAVHGLNWSAWEDSFSKSGALQEALKAKDEGLIGHICFSFHDTSENLIKLIDLGVFEGFTAQYNLLDRSLEKAFHHAADKGLGVIVMGPIGGGRLIQPSENLQQVMGGESCHTPRIALKFVLSHPAVTCAISGMSSKQMVDENCTSAAEAHLLSAEEWSQIQRQADELHKLSELYCTGCGYCTPCPNDVNIPENFRLMNLSQVWGQTDSARKQYAKLADSADKKRGKQASECLMCGECEPKCPQQIPIMQQLKATAEILGNPPTD